MVDMAGMRLVLYSTEMRIRVLSAACCAKDALMPARGAGEAKDSNVWSDDGEWKQELVERRDSSMQRARSQSTGAKPDAGFPAGNRPSFAAPRWLAPSPPPSPVHPGPQLPSVIHHAMLSPEGPRS